MIGRGTGQGFRPHHPLSPAVVQARSKDSKLEDNRVLVAAMVLLVMVSTHLLKGEHVVLAWGLALSVTVGCCWASLLAAVLSLVGAMLGLLHAGSVAMLLSGHTLGLSGLILPGLVDKRPWVVMTATALLLLGNNLGRGLGLSAAAVGTTAWGVMLGARNGQLSQGLQSWAIALALDKHALRQTVPALVSSGLVLLAVVTALSKRGMTSNAQRSSGSGDAAVTGLLLLTGACAVMVPGLEVVGCTVAAVGLLSRHWGFWQRNFTVERVGDLMSSNPSVIEGRTDDIIANRNHGGIPNASWAASEWVGVLLLIVGCWMQSPVSLLGLLLMAVKSHIKADQRSDWVSGFMDDKWVSLAPAAPQRTYTIRDGLYVVKRGGRHVGNAVGYKGTLHTNYHVTGGHAVLVGDALLEPQSISLTDDSITYGGLWALEKTKIPDNANVTVQVKQSNTGIRVYQVRTGVVITSAGRAPYIGVDFLHGSSGSPVMYDGVPVGLYGNGAYESGTFVSWVSVGDHLERADEGQPTVQAALGEEHILIEGGHKRLIIDHHPGFGKTRKVILKLVQDHVGASRRITLLAPTRVVMGEIAEVLNENGIRFETSSGQYGKALVVVMCHATFMNMILGKPHTRNVNGTLVMDEAHFLDCRSIAARGIMEDHYMRGLGSVAFLTATPPGKIPQLGSNYEIETLLFNNTEKDIGKLVKKADAQKWRTIIFVPSKRLVSETAAMLRATSERKSIVELHRDVYETNAPLAKNKETAWIVTTNIAEMGGNFSVDLCIDFGTVNRPVLVDGAVKLETAPETKASWIQRRGRVGRNRKGYHAIAASGGDIESKPLSDPLNIAWTEARMILDQLSIAGMQEEMEFLGIPGAYTLDEKKQSDFVFSVANYHEEREVWLCWKMISENVSGDEWKYSGTIASGQKDSKGREYFLKFHDDRVLPLLPSMDLGRRVEKPMYGTSLTPAFRSVPVPTLLLSLVTKGHALMQVLSLQVISDGLVFFQENGALDPEMQLRAEKGAILLACLAVAAVLALVIVCACCCRRKAERYIQQAMGGPMEPSARSGGIAYAQTSSSFQKDLEMWIPSGISAVVLIVLLWHNCDPVLSLIGSVFTFHVTTRTIKGGEGVTMLLAGMALIGVVRYVDVYGDSAFLAWLRPQPTVQSVRMGPAPEHFVPIAEGGAVDLGLKWTMTGTRVIAGQAAYMLVVSVLTPLVIGREGQLAMANAGGLSSPQAKALTPRGLVLDGVEWRGFILYVASVIGGDLRAVAAGVVCGSIVLVFSLAIDRGKFFSSESRAAAQNFKNRDETLDFPPLNSNMGWLKTVVSFVFYTVVCLVNAWISYGSVSPQRVYMVLLLTLLPAGMKLYSYLAGADPLPISLACSAANVADGNWGVMLVAALTMAYAFVTRKITVPGSKPVGRGANRVKHQVEEKGIGWKQRLNSLSQARFYEYRLADIMDYERGDYVSRGGVKMEQILQQSGFKPRGLVVDLGCGRGGWSQFMARQKDVTSVKGYTAGGDKREWPQRFDTLGHNLVEFLSGVDVYSMEPFRSDVILCDIGESDPDWEREERRTLKNIELLRSWLVVSPQADFIVKVLCPYSVKVLRAVEGIQNLTRKGKLVRIQGSRNSTAEMYLVSGPPSQPTMAAMATMATLVRRMNEMKETLGTVPGPELEKGTRAVPFTGMHVEENRYAMRLETLRNKFHLTWSFDINNPYKAFKYLGGYTATAKNPGGQAVNYVVKGIMWPWEKLSEVTRYMMTDTSTAAQQELLRKKVDVVTPEPPPELANLNRGIQTWLWKLMFKKRKARIMTREEFMNNIRNDAAVGGWCDEISWPDVKTALDDPRFWDLVNSERELHLNGQCKWCVYNTMGKKEKKTSAMGRAKGSRVIWYLWLGGRFLEYEALGFLNADHWVARDVLPCGVGGLGVQYLGNILREISSRTRYLVADDTAGWDTTVSRSDLDDELSMMEFIDDPYHRALVQACYENLYKTVVAVFPRGKTEGGIHMDVCVRGDQRGSGQVVTYALNTITNAKIQLGRSMEAMGVMQDLARADHVAIHKWLDRHGLELLENMAIAGDDCVVGTDLEEFATALQYVNDNGKTRKDIGKWVPSQLHTDWTKVEFCSHHFHELAYKGHQMVVPCRSEAEVVGRSRIQKGGIVTAAESAPMAKAYAQMWLLFFFHRRDLRQGAFGICSAVPVDWVPTGRTTWSIHAGGEWMTNEDMLTVWNRVWIQNNPWMHSAEEARFWSEVPYLPHKTDVACGCQETSEDRKAWSKSLPDNIRRMREHIGQGHRYMDYIRAQVRYQQPTRGGFY